MLYLRSPEINLTSVLRIDRRCESARTKHKSGDVFVPSLQRRDTQGTAVSGGAPGSDAGAAV